eukprot:GHVR01093027.1.p2 GENE.GHVR01093027.1~~GHVR01093027.1.p2  ORF type:complete len:112 (-),score=13.91 GHVR01093027.1:704-1039(-)
MTMCPSRAWTSRTRSRSRSTSATSAGKRRLRQNGEPQGNATDNFPKQFLHYVFEAGLVVGTICKQAKTHKEIKDAFLGSQKDADQTYQGWKEKLGRAGVLSAGGEFQRERL